MSAAKLWFQSQRLVGGDDGVASEERGKPGNASSDDVLREAGIAKAKGLIATLASDADNLFLILSAKSLNARLHLAARVDEEASEQKMRRAGADFVFAPYNSTGHHYRSHFSMDN